MTAPTADATGTTQRPVIKPAGPARATSTAVAAGEAGLPGRRLCRPRHTLAADATGATHSAASVDRQRLPVYAAGSAITAGTGVDAAGTRPTGTPGSTGSTIPPTRGPVGPTVTAIAAARADTTRAARTTGTAPTPPTR